MMSRRRLLLNLPAVLVAAVIPRPRTNDYSPLPTPQFRIGQQVKTWYDLEGYPESIEVTGTVKGLCWQPDGWRIEVGWVYQVSLPPNQLLESDACWEEIPEFDLEPM